MSDREVKVFILKAVHNCGSHPIPEGTLKASVKLGFPHLNLTDGQVAQVINELDSEGWITGTNDTFIGRVWTLTNKGKLQVQQLG